MNWKDLLKKLFTPSNLRKVGKVAYDAANKQADKMEKDKAKSQLRFVITAAHTIILAYSSVANVGMNLNLKLKLKLRLVLKN